MPISSMENDREYVTCVTCMDTGWEKVDAEGRVKRCSTCQNNDGAPSTPVEFKSARLANYESVPGNEAARKVAQAFLLGAKDLFLFGGVGSGKTRLACSLLNDHWQAHRSGQFYRVQALLSALQPSTDSTRSEIALRTALDAPLLVLDDLAAERDEATDFTRRTVLQIYEGRGDVGLRTILTSNKSLAELSAFFDDDRLISRIAGRADIVHVKAADQRLARRKR